LLTFAEFAALVYTTDMQEVFVTGHRNPDMDSVSAAWAYAKLMNKIDLENRYRPIRCGHLNTQTKETFKTLGIRPPRLEKDVYPRVEDIYSIPKQILSPSDSIHDAIKAIHDHNVSVIPVLDEEKRFAGFVSVNEISDFSIHEHVGGRPRYSFLSDNFEKVLPGFCYRQGDEREFTAAIMVGAMPFEVSVERIRALQPEKPLLVVGMRRQILEYAVEIGVPAIVLTGIDRREEIDFDFSSYRGTVFVSLTDTAETARLLRLSSSVHLIMRRKYPSIYNQDHFDEAKQCLIDSDFRGLPVFSAEDESFLGVVTRRCFIDRPKRKLIMVDHNEADQSIRGIEHAEIVQIIDHHRLAAEKTKSPIYVAAKPVGSTCTIVYQHYLHHGEEIDQTTANVLLAGIISDTVMLKSPTSTAEDRAAAKNLCSIAGVELEEFGTEIFRHTAVLSSREPKEIVEGDFKFYEQQDYRVGIGQVEVVTFQDLPDFIDALRSTLESKNKEAGLDWTMLLISNVLSENSKLLSTKFPEGEKRLVYRKEQEDLFDLPGILSRKKQLLPEVFRVLEELKAASP
jgi:manganese-dependent inorganic pyrophosphatase